MPLHTHACLSICSLTHSLTQSINQSLNHSRPNTSVHQSMHTWLVTPFACPCACTHSCTHSRHEQTRARARKHVISQASAYVCTRPAHNERFISPLEGGGWTTSAPLTEAVEASRSGVVFILTPSSFLRVYSQCPLRCGPPAGPLAPVHRSHPSNLYRRPLAGHWRRGVPRNNTQGRQDWR